MVPKLNLKVSTSSVDDFVIGCDNEKFKGPIGVNQSKAIPNADLNSLLSLIEES